MFDRIGGLAEKVATNVSRRAFLGRMGQGALGLAAVIGGLLAFPAQGHAGDNGHYCCVDQFRCYVAINKTCPCGGSLVHCNKVSGCNQTCP